MTIPGAGPSGAGAGVDGVLNFRDVGGLPAGAGTTRSGVLFRSAHLARLSDQGREELRALGVRRIVDLRADDEVAFEPSRIEGLEVETLRAPLFSGSTSSFFERDATLDQLYRSLVDESSVRIVEVVRAVLETRPALVHCTAGKDRTGVIVGIMLAAAGVDEEAVVADYAATAGHLSPERNAFVLARLRRMHPEARNLEELATRSPARAMRTVLDSLTVRFGSPAGYLRAQGMSDAELADLRGALIAAPAPEHPRAEDT